MPQPSRIALLETMMLIRAHEERLAQDAGQTPGTCTAVGQEAAAAGVMAALQPRDRILTNHRSAGHLLARGADPGRLMAEVMGRADGYCRGKSGSLHVSAKELGVVLTSTIVGGELSLAPGVALAQKMGGAHTEPGGITAVIFGDGACGYGLAEFDTFVRHGVPVIAVVGNDAGWTQIAREQVKILGDDVATVLARSDYHMVAAGFGAEGLLIQRGYEVRPVLRRARELARQGRAVLVNVWLDKTQFREGSLSM